MGLLSKSENKNPAGSGTQEEKKSWYARYHDKKRGKPIDDEELQKHLGMNKEELKIWARDRPGVGKNQLAGSAGKGSMSGLGGMAMADGLGGWGPEAEPKEDNRGLKFPPAKTGNKHNGTDE
ncbi:uncharacterized protein F5Z01DRAFT_753730 [Emericellopsis atlantica]|uniref:Uncharacterized protein n=1 Tax=Emericellopsis atlantica TaxID=2614577 RepID=A0A9P7ZE77_9HYPO|nr:uncharacterized protein F5Z01DRAFT_753730 [Emericellopsis atlantica]KAG9250316.1 hypothetical protein F5Z01DRAFT_753730 [Emericellopsis atlantica]